jgi:hypothetical protein
VIPILVTLLSLAFLAGGQPAARPNFSGTWKMNVAKSNFGQMPAPDFMTRSITHAEPALTIDEELGPQKTTRKYVTDGTPTTFESNGVPVNSAASWTGDTLLVKSTVEAMSLGIADTMSLSVDGKTMTSVVALDSPQGAATLTIVFEKQ